MAPWSWSLPSDARVDALRAAQAPLPCSYRDVGATRTLTLANVPDGFNYDETRAQLGVGEGAFAAACAAIRAWVMFPQPWTRIDPPHAPIREGTIVAMRAHALGFWWLNACRILYVIDEPAGAAGPGAPRRFGFAYGTLPAHVECGEERFSVEQHADGSVWYDLRAFSRPRYWMVRLGKPLARSLQRRFARESVAAMQRAVSAATDHDS
jgi:uncharacterized protein (UPF0548 family)